MSPGSRDDSAEVRTVRRPDARPEGEPADWVTALTSSGAEQQSALRQLHDLMLRAAGYQLNRMRSALPDGSPTTCELIVNSAADEAMTALLGKLHTFQGRSRFTTWAFKFAILQVATDVRRLQWQHREVELRDVDLAATPATEHESPERLAEVSDLASAVVRSMHAVLTPHQRRVAVALLVDGVPIDVLAERLGTSRGALYKTVHEARGRLRADLTGKGYLRSDPSDPTGAKSSKAAPADTRTSPTRPSDTPTTRPLAGTP